MRGQSTDTREGTEINEMKGEGREAEVGDKIDADERRRGDSFKIGMGGGVAQWGREEM